MIIVLKTKTFLPLHRSNTFHPILVLPREIFHWISSLLQPTRPIVDKSKTNHDRAEIEILKADCGFSCFLL